MNTQYKLPPGQHEIDHFPRFGLSKYAKRFKTEFEPFKLVVSGDVQNPITVGTDDLESLPRVQQESDFHCVTTWTKKGLLWSGFRFSDFYKTIVQPKAQPSEHAEVVIFKSQDGYRTTLLLTDLMSEDVLLADTLDSEPLSAKHGAPLRLVAPAQYGYKSVKHLKAIEFWQDESRFRPPAFRFMGHPRGRVAFEERGRGVPGWLLRILYRPLVKPTIRKFEHAMQKETTEGAKSK